MSLQLYQAIQNLTTAQLLEEAASHKSYFVDQVPGHPDLLSFTYGYQDNGMFKTELSLLFRGLTYDTVNECIVLFPLTKFWAINEVEETQYSNLDLRNVLWVLDKVDGVMLLLTHYQDKPLLRSKRRFLEAEGFLPPNLIEFSRYFGKDYTIAIEWVPVNGPDYNLLVPNETERFVVTRMTDNRTGQSLDPDVVAGFCKTSGIECVSPLEVDFTSRESIEKTLGSDRNKEGYVLVLNNGSGIHTYVKAKTGWYNTMRFATVDDLSHRVVYDAWANQTLDDLIAYVETNGRSSEHLRTFGNTLTTMLNDFKTVSAVLAEKYKNIDPKQIKDLPKTPEVTTGLRLMRGHQIDWLETFSRKLRHDKFDFNALLGSHQK